MGCRVCEGDEDSQELCEGCMGVILKLRDILIRAIADPTVAAHTEIGPLFAEATFRFKIHEQVAMVRAIQKEGQ